MPALGLFGSLNRDHASVDSVFADRGNGCGDEEGARAIRTVECVRADLGQGGGKRDAFKIVPVAECVGFDLDNSLFQDQGLDVPVAKALVVHGMYDDVVALYCVDGDGLVSLVVVQMCQAVFGQEVGHAVLVGVERACGGIPDDPAAIPTIPAFVPAVFCLCLGGVYVAIVECIFTDSGNGGRQADVQAGVVEGVITNDGDARVNDDRGNTASVL